MNPHNPSPPGPRVVTYQRDSGGREQELSIDQQRAKIVEFCQANNLIITRAFQDVAKSGGAVAGRASFLDMIQHFEKGAPEIAVIIWSYSRLTRDYDDFQYYVTSLRRLGKQVISITDTVPDTLDGRILESIIAWKNAKYRQDLSRDVKRGLHYVVQIHHAYPSPRPPTGYMIQRVAISDYRSGGQRTIPRLIPDPVTSPLVRQAFEMRANGATEREILAACPNLSDSPASLGRLLRRRVYIGEYEYSDIIVTEYCQPIVDKDTWQRAQDIIQARRTKYGSNHPRAVRSRFILTGLIYCSACGSPMVGMKNVPQNGKTYSYYRCVNKANGGPCRSVNIPKDLVENSIIEILARICSSEIDLTEIVADLQSQSEKNQSELVLTRQGNLTELARTRARISRLVSAIAEAGHSVALLQELKTLEEKERDLYILTEKPKPEKQMPTLDQIRDQIRPVLENATLDEKRDIVRGFVSRLDVLWSEPVERPSDRRNRQLTGHVTLWLGNSLSL